MQGGSICIPILDDEVGSADIKSVGVVACGLSITFRVRLVTSSCWEFEQRGHEKMCFCYTQLLTVIFEIVSAAGLEMLKARSGEFRTTTFYTDGSVKKPTRRAPCKTYSKGSRRLDPVLTVGKFPAISSRRPTSSSVRVL